MIDSIGTDFNPEFGNQSIPHLGSELQQTVGYMRPRDVLQQNLRALMETRRDLDTIVKVEKASGVSKGVVERMTKAEANTGVDHLAGIAAAFGVNVWDLLRAPEQAAESSPQPPSLVQALKVVAEAARQQPLDVRANAAEILALVVKQPEKNAPDMIPIIVKHLSGGELSSDSRRAA